MKNDMVTINAIVSKLGMDPKYYGRTCHSIDGHTFAKEVDDLPENRRFIGASDVRYIQRNFPNEWRCVSCYQRHPIHDILDDYELVRKEQLTRLIKDKQREAIEGFVYGLGMNFGFDFMSLEEHAKVNAYIIKSVEEYLSNLEESEK